MDIKTALKAVTEQRHLSMDEMSDVMHIIMTGQATPAQIGGFLIGLRMKGETVEEITAAAQIMRGLATPVSVPGMTIVDIVGTGGDGASTFNISTASAFVVAAAGGKVAKHGNRSVSSQSGSADVLEALGVNINLTPQQVTRCIEQVGFGFMFAPLHHSAMKYAIAPRREMGVRTVFNLLGPLTNPANALRQVVGVYQRNWVEPIAHVLHRLGSEHAMVVHSEEGLDEISLSAPTFVAELRHNQVTTYSICPEHFGLHRVPLSTLQVHSVIESVAKVQQVLDNHPSAALDVVVLNAAAALYVSGLVDTFVAGIKLAQETLRSGAARKCLNALVELTRSMSH